MFNYDPVEPNPEWDMQIDEAITWTLTNALKEFSSVINIDVPIADLMCDEETITLAYVSLIRIIGKAVNEALHDIDNGIFLYPDYQLWVKEEVDSDENDYSVLKPITPLISKLPLHRAVQKVFASEEIPFKYPYRFDSPTIKAELSMNNSEPDTPLFNGVELSNIHFKRLSANLRINLGLMFREFSQLQVGIDLGTEQEKDLERIASISYYYCRQIPLQEKLRNRIIIESI